VIRASVTAPTEQAEELRARFIDLAPEGFEEQARAGVVELAAYGSSAERVLAAYPAAAVTEIDPDWTERWRSFHRPVEIGPLWVGPPWQGPPPGSLPVVIDPGRAFGTGAHPTTRLCVELLLGESRGSLLDVGCGSGVIAIAAVRLGFGPVLAIDDDPVAVEVTRANARANGVTLAARRFDALAGGLPACDLAAANISLAAIEAAAPQLAVARLITSGYLACDRPGLPGFRHLARRQRDGWAADLFALA
jgi:ribosomal protein L11 methyltransferase